jgi:hypothetical protein
MNADQFLASREMPAHYEKMITELDAVQNGKAQHPLLTATTAELGLLLMSDGEAAKENVYYGFRRMVAYQSTRYNRIKELMPAAGWEDPAAWNLLVYIYGEEMAPAAKLAWNRIPHEMYQRGSYRRSFTAPNDPEIYFTNQVNLIVLTCLPSFKISYVGGYTISTYQLNLEEQIRYDQVLQAEVMYKIWAAAIDLSNTAVFQLIEDIVYNKESIGKVTRGIIKSLLASHSEKAWKLAEQLLLAAQRQEGLRQTILEALDECSLGALKYIIRVLIDHKMSRFSSVVRALDTWTGLNWEAEKESAVNQFLEKAHSYLTSPGLIPDAMKSPNNMDVYMALWAQGIFDIAETRPLLVELLRTGNADKRCLALMFAAETRYYNVDMPLFYEALDDKDEAVLGTALLGVKNLMHGQGAHYDKYFPELFDRLQKAAQRAPEKQKTFSGTIFSGRTTWIHRSDALAAMLPLVLEKQERLDVIMTWYDTMELSLKEQLARLVFPKHGVYHWEKKKDVAAPLTPFQRKFAFRLLKDRGEYLINIAFNALDDEPFDVAEMEPFVELLKRKGASARSKAIALILRQRDELVQSAASLLLQGDGEQRVAGLDIAVQLKKQGRLAEDIRQWRTVFRERKSIAPREEVLLQQLSEEEGTLAFDETNGYGLFDPALILPAALPAIKEDDEYGRRIRLHSYGFSKPVADMKASLAALEELMQAHGDHEYEVEYYDGSRSKILLSNAFNRNKPYNYTFETPEAEYASYPLPEVWDHWYQAQQLTPADLFILNTLMGDAFELPAKWKDFTDNFYPSYEQLAPQTIVKKYGHRTASPITAILIALSLIHPFPEKNEFLIGATTRLFASLPEEVLQKNYEATGWPYYHGGWQSIPLFNKMINAIDIPALTNAMVTPAWQLFHWMQFTGRPEFQATHRPPLAIFCKAFEAGVISESELYRGLISVDNIRMLSQAPNTRWRQWFDYFKHFPFLKEMYTRGREHFLDIELKRGDSATPVTKFVQVLDRIYGIDRLSELLSGLGKTSLHRGYVYTYGDKDLSRQIVFSMLLKRCLLTPTDTQEAFDAAMKRIKAGETQLIEAAVYAPQWQRFVSNYLNWKGLDSAIWWMHAHTKASGGSEQNAEAESEIARYSAVDLADFKAGAVDKEWFLKAYKEIGKARWQIVYDAAKYISDGNEHRRARLYADVITGELKIKEITQKIKEKRDQDYLRMYGLVPLSKARQEKDLLERYNYLQQFKKESRQFGAQRQSSEALAMRIAMENLARNAGYADPLRLTWAMETRQVQQILSKETQVQYDDVTIGLIIDETGVADLVAFKGDKELKAIPPKYKKDKKVEELTAFRKILREQFSRSRKSLEDAMVRGDGFLYAELQELFGHPVISRHLEKLVFVAGDKHGFYHNGALVSATGQQFELAEGDHIRIAHCTDLYQLKVWSDYQRYAFDKQLQQPFKQIFRELYVPLADELAEKTISRRYAGHQVQPSQTVALLKNRHWKVDYEEGLQKVFHKEGFAAKIYALANWFSPGEVESPTLETLEFLDLKTGMAVPFEKISPLIFSEVMRDIDLVVSVAHVGGVDPEASHSSIEMRSVLLTETLRLFKLNNVTVSGSHARIKGQHGEYSVHLGSAIVHQLPGKYLSILPVHSQHRGRIFLPFLDDDPKSAELISKVLLLARDQEIQDPTILSQLSMN